MKVDADAVVPFPRPIVFSAYRDEMPGFVPYLPNVRAIEVKERTDEGQVTKLLNVWHGGGEIPAPLRGLLSESMVSWTDRARWDENAWTCDWQIETHVFTEAVHCHGTNRFVEIDAGRTRLEIRGEISIDMKRVRAVPSFLAGSLGRSVEQFLVKQITPNLTSVSAAMTEYLKKRAG